MRRFPDRLRALDWWIIGKLESFCRWTYRNIGANSITWERLCLVLKVVGLVIEFGGGLEHRSAGDWWCVGMLTSIAVFDFVRTFRKQAHVKRQGEFMNPLKLRWGWRLWALFWSCYCLASVPLSYWFECMTLAAYFRACDDDPPAECRLKKFLKSLDPRKLKQPEAALAQ